jgi:hypothetical protein
MVSMNLSARSNNYLHTQLRWFESHYICFVQHFRYPQGRLRKCVKPRFHSPMLKSHGTVNNT